MQDDQQKQELNNFMGPNSPDMKKADNKQKPDQIPVSRQK